MLITAALTLALMGTGSYAHKLYLDNKKERGRYKMLRGCYTVAVADLVFYRDLWENVGSTTADEQ